MMLDYIVDVFCCTPYSGKGCCNLITPAKNAKFVQSSREVFLKRSSFKRLNKLFYFWQTTQLLKQVHNPYRAYFAREWIKCPLD